MDLRIYYRICGDGGKKYLHVVGNGDSEQIEGGAGNGGASTDHYALLISLVIRRVKVQFSSPNKIVTIHFGFEK
jgi:hypothetical protein